MAYMQIGDNLYADQLGKYYNLNNGNYANTVSPFDTQQQKINDLYNAQQKNQLDLLRGQRDKAVAGFNRQKQDMRPQYQNQRNQADVVNAQNVTRLRELMAAQGINASGENLTTQAQMASARQGALSEIDTNEAFAIRQIDDQIARENDPAREQAIINAIEAERSGKLADAFSQAQSEIYNRSVDWRNYQMQLQQFELEKRMKELEMQRIQQQMAQAAAARRGGSRTTAKKTATTTTAKAPASVNNFNAAKASQSAVERYAANPLIQNVEQKKMYDLLYRQAFPGNPVSIADNPNLTAWDKMKMLGG